jgi:hypothetical protein
VNGWIWHDSYGLMAQVCAVLKKIQAKCELCMNFVLTDTREHSYSAYGRRINPQNNRLGLRVRKGSGAHSAQGYGAEPQAEGFRIRPKGHRQRSNPQTPVNPIAARSHTLRRILTAMRAASGKATTLIRKAKASRQ